MPPKDWLQTLSQTGLKPPPGLRPLRFVVNPGAGKVSARFAVDVVPDEAMRKDLSMALGRVFPRTQVSVILSCPDLWDDFLANPQDYVKQLSTMLIGIMPGAAPMLATSHWSIEESVLTLRMENAIGHRLLKQRGFAAEVAGLIHLLFSQNLNVKLTSPGSIEDELARRRKSIESIDASEIKDAALKLATAANKSAGKPVGTVLLGKPVKAKKPTLMADLNDASGMVSIKGRVFDVEVRELRGGYKTLLTFAISDFTNSIRCKVFITDENKSALGVETGMWLWVKGHCILDAYMQDICIMADDIMTSEHAPRTDDEPVKRIELHAHTQMSSMDGVVSAHALVTRAKEWGHEAIAITDHGVTQAFPDATSVKGGPRILFGIEGYLMDEPSSIVAQPDARPISCSIVVLDIETTGLSPNTDHITEIAAVRVVDGQLTDEFSTFVNPGVPIPRRITELTGITDGMVRDAPSEAEAVTALSAFIGGDAICAHNASFDTAFLRRVARDARVHISPTVIDTLTLSRALLPQLGSHKLKLVCEQLGVSLEGAHRAINDTRATAQVLLKLMASAQQSKGASTLADLAMLGGKKTAKSQKKGQAGNDISYCFAGKDAKRA